MKKRCLYLNNTQNLLIISALLSLMMFACTADKAPIPAPINSSSNCDTIKYKYNTEVKNIVSSNCVGCHSIGSSNGDLSSYANLKAFAQSGALMGSLKGQSYPQMPPAGKLSDCDIKGIENWVLAGANND